MTKRQAENYARLLNVMVNRLGVSVDDFAKLMRIEKALHRWGERECENVETDDDGSAWVVVQSMSGPSRRYRTANRERGALKRLDAILAKYPKLAVYHQGDPRGCALYVYEKGKLRKVEGCRQSVCWCHDSTATPPRLCSDCGCHVVERDIDSAYNAIGVALCV